jgi:acyl-CoA reductase-like NAD-dependent aldehyde dehydrogenase
VRFYIPLDKVRLTSIMNTALHNAWSPILASIFAGNGVVLKCSEHVIWSTSWFVGAIQECLRACGHDSDLIQVCIHRVLIEMPASLIANIAVSLLLA